MDLEDWSTRLKVFADATRVRLLALLEQEELTVAELSAITRLAQPRVSTHLAKLKEAGLVRDRRAGVSAYYRFDEAQLDPAQRALWLALSTGSDDPLLRQDAERVAAVLANRAADQNWADSVAGDMERHYSPGRTWEALARTALPLLETGDVLDIASGDGVLAELVAPHARRYVCIDTSARVVAAASERLRRLGNVEVREGDMHALPFADASFDLVVMMHALTYAAKPAQAVAESARVLRPGGRLLLCSLARHEHKAAVHAYGHVNLGFASKELRKFVHKAGLDVSSLETVTREKRPPHFEVVSLIAVKPGLGTGDWGLGTRKSPSRSRSESMNTSAFNRIPSPESRVPGLPWLHPQRTQKLLQALAERILIIDGAMGTMIQRHDLQEADYRGARFAAGYDGAHVHGPGCDHAPQGHDLKGNNDLLLLSRPEVIAGIHRAYLDAGADLLETNTFNATSISQADYHLEHLVYELNKAGAQVARDCCDAVEALTPNQPRFVIGVLGPTSRTASISPDVNDPGFRNTSFDELRGTYREAVEGLIDGGADTLMVETIFDTLNAKAALYAIEEVFDARGARLPVMISGTITDASGRTLSGQTAEAFYASVAHGRPLSVGLNCALGASDLRPHVETLARIADGYVSAHPNAGLPNAFGEYDETPEEMAATLKEFAESGLLNLVGGCCGTTPAHIQAIAEAMRGLRPRTPLAAQVQAA